MTTEQERQHPHSHLFVLRIWEESLGEGKAEWRGRVQEIVTGETAYFRDWPGLVAILSRLVTGPVSVQTVAPGGAQTASDDL